MATEPTTELDPRYGDATDPTPWPTARAVLAGGSVAHLTTVRADGRPHVTPLLVVWDGDALHFCSGPGEQKTRNLAGNPNVAVTVRSEPDVHLDVVVDGAAERVTDEARLAELAEAWVATHGEDWRFAVRDNAFHSEDGGHAHVFAVRPRVAWGFSTGEPFSQTRWTFPG